MIIDVKQTNSECKNEFDIIYNNIKKYSAKLPFIHIKEPFNLDNLKQIEVFSNKKLVYKTEYNYIDNKFEELIPMKYLFTKLQKFFQLKFINQKDNDDIKIYFEEKEIWNSYNVIEYKNNYYRCYSIEDGYIRHLCIYLDDIQFAELLKPNVVIDGKDEYRIFLKDEYEYLKDALSMLALYLDRTEYNSSYLVAKNEQLQKSYSYSKVNKYYNQNWVKDNFDSKEYFEKIDNEIIKVKNDISKKFKKIMKIFGIVYGIIILVFIILFIILK